MPMSTRFLMPGAATLALIAGCGGASKPAASPAPVANAAADPGAGADGSGTGYGGAGYGDDAPYPGDDAPARTYDPPLADFKTECDGYLAAMNTLVTCDKYPPAARQAFTDSIPVMTETWTQLATTPNSEQTQAQVAEACRISLDAVRQTADAMGCPRP